MALGKLSALQERILIALAGVSPPWTLSDEAALAGFHTAHRETRDLDLFWQKCSELGDVARRVRLQLEGAGLTVVALQTGPAFSQLDVVDESGSHVTVDLLPTKSNSTTVFGAVNASTRQEQVPLAHSMTTAPSPGVARPCCAMQSALIAQFGSDGLEGRGPPPALSSWPAIANLKLSRPRDSK